MKIIYMEPTINLFANKYGVAITDELVNKGIVVQNEELKTAWLVIQDNDEKDTDTSKTDSIE